MNETTQSAPVAPEVALVIANYIRAFPERNCGECMGNHQRACFECIAGAIAYEAKRGKGFVTNN